MGMGRILRNRNVGDIVMGQGKLYGYDEAVHIDFGTDGKIIFTADVEVEFTGDISVDGSFTFGDAATDKLTVNGYIEFGASTADYLIDANAATPAVADIRLSNGATIANGAAATLTITEEIIDLTASTRIDLDGAVAVSGDMTFDTAGTDAITIDADFTHGINITSNCTPTDGILIAGAAADGIEISGNCTAYGINISGDMTTAAMVITGTQAIAWQATGATITKLFEGTVTMTGSTALNGFEITVNETFDHNTGYARGLYVNYTHTTNAITGSGECNAFAVDMTVTGDSTYAFAASLYTGGLGTATVAHLSAIYIYMDDIGGGAACSVKHALDLNIDNGDNATVCAYLRCYNHSPAASDIDYFVDFPNAGIGGCNNLFHVGCTGGMTEVSAVPGTQDIRVKVLVASTQYYIALYR